MLSIEQNNKISGIKLVSLYSNINTWFKVNSLTVKLNKTQYLEFRTKNYYNNVNTQIKYDQECITSTSEIKFLVLTIDDTLSWKQHTEQALNTMCTACYALRNIKHIVPIDTPRVINFAYIQSYKIWYNFLEQLLLRQQGTSIYTPKENYQNYN